MDNELSRYVRFGGTAVTNVDPIVLFFVVLAGLLIFVVPRKYIIIPFFVPAFFIPLGQQWVIGGLHFFMFRILLLFGWGRVVFGLRRGLDSKKFKLNSIDKIFLCYALAGAVAFTLLWSDWLAFVNQLGQLFNILGTYFFLRMVYTDQDDVDRTTGVFAFICVVIALCMINEQLTGRNFFSVFGGVPKITDIRDGSLRSQGPFEHPILAGTFGAVMTPFFIGRWWRRKGRALALLGFISGLAIAIASGSSTPLGAIAAMSLAFVLWRWRRWMRQFRWGLAAVLVILQIAMKSPVWALIGRFDVTGKSSGYHRYILIDNFIRRFGEWWLIGVKDTAHWGYDMWDVSDQYVNVGVTGGLVAFALFIAVIVYCFKGLGLARKEAEAIGDLQTARNMWTLGAALFANMIAFIGITYFDQTQIVWYTLVAMIATVTFGSDMVPAVSPETVRAVEAGVGRLQNQNGFANVHTRMQH